MNQPTSPTAKTSVSVSAADLSGYGAQVIEENGSFALTFWPYCTKCQSPFQFDAEEPFAYCSCGTTEWGDPRPASWVRPPSLAAGAEGAQLPKGAPDAKYAELMNNIEHAAISRYRPVPAGVFAYAVVAGNGVRKLFTGTKDECAVVVRKLTEAFLDGAHMAISARTAHVAEKTRQEHEAEDVPLLAAEVRRLRVAQGDALSPADAEQLEKAITDFEDCGETDVPDAALQRFAVMGYLECACYTVPPAARAAIDAARAQQEER